MAQLETQSEFDFLRRVLERICELKIFESTDMPHLQELLNGGIIEILGVDSESMRKINAEFLGKDKTTDVLSFPLHSDIQASENGIMLGSIIINTELAEKCAKLYRHSFESETTLLFVHGLLHILGYDHESDNGEHREMEDLILQTLDIESGLIKRQDDA